MILTTMFMAAALTITPIHAIQGPGLSSTYEGQTVTIEGIVTADFQARERVNGFFLQARKEDQDGDPATSEGIFVYSTFFDVSPQDLVRVTGKVIEYRDLTEITSVQEITILEKGVPLPEPEALSLPLPDIFHPERFEGMAVGLPQSLTVSDNSQLALYGSFLLSWGRRFQPTQIADPGADAERVSKANALDRIIVDDGLYTSDPWPVIYPRPALSHENPLRCGTEISGFAGVLTQGYEEYRIHPAYEASTVPTVFNTAPNPRTVTPEISGRIIVAAFNLENYFNGPLFPTERGAATLEEFQRQRAKIISALFGMNADIIGIIEVENDGYGPDSAIADLTRGLNVRIGEERYTFVDPKLSRLGTDAIAVGLLYRADRVKPVGSAATRYTGAFSSQHRQPLAQTFEEIATGERFTAVVNHFRSRRSPCPEDTLEGQQGWCNGKRTEAAADLAAWLETDPTGSEDPDFLIIGDLNAYAKEDPLKSFADAGYTDIVAAVNGFHSYSYLYDGEAGTLDYALASPSLTPQIDGAGIWHINADEPYVFDYQLAGKTEAQKTLYDPGPFRSSDHDPVLAGLNLCAGGFVPELADALVLLKILAGMVPENGYTGPDLKSDGRIGFEEMIYILQAVTSARSGCPSAGSF